MAELFAYLTGPLMAAGVYLVLDDAPVRRLFGVVLIGNAVNLGILALGRSASLVPPVVPPGLEAPVGAVANPLPQALVLTALVISFGLTAFALALITRLARGGEAVVEASASPRVEAPARRGSPAVAEPDAELAGRRG